MNNQWRRKPPTITVDARPIAWVAGAIFAVFAAIIVISSSAYIVQPGNRGIAVTLGKVAPEFKREGFGLKPPFFTTIHSMSIRQQTRAMAAECYSSDLQQVNMEVQALYRIPERSVVRIFQEYAGQPFDNLIAPRVQEAIKEVAATYSAEQIVKRRREVKLKAIELARKKIDTNFLELEDLVLSNLSLSAELEQAIEMKMVQEQEAAKAKFTQLKAQIEADTAIIRAKGEAEAIEVRGRALRANPAFVKLEMIESWNGRSPMVVGTAAGGNILLDPPDINTPADRPRPVPSAKPAPRPKP